MAVNIFMVIFVLMLMPPRSMSGGAVFYVLKLMFISIGVYNVISILEYFI
jgi:hypothetical protein